jgi:pyrophosphatase PpaX
MNQQISMPKEGIIKAVIFDSDGTLVDTRRLILEGYVRNLRSHGYGEWSYDDVVIGLGQPVYETYQNLLGGRYDLSAGEYKELETSHDDIQNAMVEEINAYEGLNELLHTLKMSHLKTGLFTSGNKMMINRNLGQVGLENALDSFDASVTADDDLRRKPFPDGILHLCQKLEVEPGKSIVVGDHHFDILAGKKAGAFATIGITHGFSSRDELEKAGADYIVDNLSELENLLQLLSHYGHNVKQVNAG